MIYIKTTVTIALVIVFITVVWAIILYINVSIDLDDFKVKIKNWFLKTFDKKAYIEKEEEERKKSEEAYKEYLQSEPYKNKRFIEMHVDRYNRSFTDIINNNTYEDIDKMLFNDYYLYKPNVLHIVYTVKKINDLDAKVENVKNLLQKIEQKIEVLNQKRI